MCRWLSLLELLFESSHLTIDKLMNFFPIRIGDGLELCLQGLWQSLSIESLVNEVVKIFLPILILRPLCGGADFL